MRAMTEGVIATAMHSLISDWCNPLVSFCPNEQLFVGN